MTHDPNNTHQDGDASSVLKRYQREQRDFETHWLWRELGTTPREFFAHVDRHVQNSGIDRRVWNERVAQAKERIAHAACRERAKRNVPQIAGLKA